MPLNVMLNVLFAPAAAVNDRGDGGRFTAATARATRNDTTAAVLRILSLRIAFLVVPDATRVSCFKTRYKMA
jgi:hypothetical protein